MSSSASNGVLPRSAAISPTVRPAQALVLRGERLDDRERAPSCASPRSRPGLGRVARPRRAGGARRGRRARFIFSAGGSAIVSRQPGSASRTNPLERLRRKRMTSGHGERHHPAAALGGVVGRRRAAGDDRRGSARSTPSTFQFSGRLAASDMRRHELEVLLGEARRPWG